MSISFSTIYVNLHGKTMIKIFALILFSFSSIAFAQDTLPKSEIEIKLRELGGKVNSSISKSTDFLIVGNDPGSKLYKARTMNIDIKGLDFVNKLMRD